MREGGQEAADAAPSEDLLRVEGLGVSYPTRQGPLPAVRDVSFTLRRGEVLGLVGESGSGKSTVLTALMRMLPRTAQLSADQVWFDGTDLSHVPERAMRRVRGRHIGLVPQRPMTSLSPVTPLRTQLRRLTGESVSDERLDELLTSVGLGGIVSRLDGYPFQFSGGQLQRTLIAVAVLAHEPQLVLADEPTTTLDVTVQAQVLRLLLDLRNRLGNSIIFVSHDLAVISQICDRVGVMYGGQLVEVAPTADLFAAPQHPYTQALLAAMPAAHVRGERLRAIEGTVSGSHRLPGCPFAPRCPRATDVCRTEVPQPQQIGATTVRCHLPGAA
ncbi:ABC transporter ATP-binding protein [Ornithinimicrobium faecis]|uniref:ABC transporter ATP-binding protein n=1 Tax=Ornithinimicrobium faecis TaxID=2934158 RepID=UPI0021185569|nr:ABC transporter ATP-binding protein [Ornithinimicrobium sp. HY1745]